MQALSPPPVDSISTDLPFAVHGAASVRPGCAKVYFSPSRDNSLHKAGLILR